jgi:hypothetical protein
VLSTVKAVLRSVHGEAASDAKASGYDLAEEVAGAYRGMMIAIPKDEWVVFHEMSPRGLRPFLKRLAGAVRLSEFRKQPRGPKKPRPERRSGAEIKHVATAGCWRSRRPNHQKAKSNAQGFIYTGLGRVAYLSVGEFRAHLGWEGLRAHLRWESLVPSFARNRT